MEEKSAASISALRCASMMIENRMLIDSEWEGVELLQMRIPDRRSKRVKRILDEMEYGNLSEREVKEDYESLRD